MPYMIRLEKHIETQKLCEENKRQEDSNKRQEDVQPSIIECFRHQGDNEGVWENSSTT